jgi:hypothetical protein
VLNLVGGGAEGSGRRRGGSRAFAGGDGGRCSIGQGAWGGKGVTRELLRVSVVLLVHLVGVKQLCNDGATARPSGGGTGAQRRCGGWCYGVRK